MKKTTAVKSLCSNLRIYQLLINNKYQKAVWLKKCLYKKLKLLFNISVKKKKSKFQILAKFYMQVTGNRKGPLISLVSKCLTCWVHNVIYAYKTS